MAQRVVFTSPQTERLAGISHRQLEHWIAIGVVRPSVDTGRGRGSRRLWSFTDVMGLYLIARLRDQDHPLPRLGRVLSALQEHNESSLQVLARSTLVVSPNNETTLVLDSDASDIAHQIKSHHHLMAPVLALHLRSVVVDVQRAMARESATDEGMAEKIEALKAAQTWFVSESHQ